MNSGRIYATREDIERYLQARQEVRDGERSDDDKLYGWVTGQLDMASDDVGAGRLIVSKWNGDYSDRFYVTGIMDHSEQEWHEHEFIAKVYHYANGRKEDTWVPIALIEEDLDEDVEEEVDSAVERLRESGVDDDMIAAVFRLHADRLTRE